jgi:hypothetical protein
VVVVDVDDGRAMRKDSLRLWKRLLMSDVRAEVRLMRTDSDSDERTKKG